MNNFYNNIFKKKKEYYIHKIISTTNLYVNNSSKVMKRIRLTEIERFHGIILRQKWIEKLPIILVR